MNRRQFLGNGGLAVVVGTLPSIAAASAYGSAKIANVIFDWQFPEARVFAAAAEARGLPVFGYHADPMDIWFERLQSDLRAGVPIIGISGTGVRFCLELSAGTDGRFVHLQRHEPSTQTSGSARSISQRLFEALDTALQQASTNCGPRQQGRLLSHPCDEPSRAQCESWVIVPRHGNLS